VWAPPAPAPLLALAAQEEQPTITRVPDPAPAPPEREVQAARVERPAEPSVDDLSFRSHEPAASSGSSDEAVEALPLAAAAPVVVTEPPLRVEPPARVDAPLRVEHPVNLMPPESLNPARSAVWPLTLALVVGVAVGFAGGYWLGQSERERDHTQAAATTSETEVRLRADSTAAPGRDGAPGPAGTSAPAPPPVASAASAPPSVPETSRPDPPPVDPPAPAVKPAPPPAAEASADTAVARTGRITVRTTPTGARVTIDGRAVGQTPLTIPNLGRGAHNVRVTRDGYSSVERRVVITPNQPTSTLTLNLTRTGAAPPRPAPAESPAQLTADVLFESRPTGATVFMDGKRIGTTPMSLPSVRTGSHAFRFEMAGHKPWTASLPVVAGEKNRIAASLEQE
jgi:hypothetical protein